METNLGVAGLLLVAHGDDGQHQIDQVERAEEDDHHEEDERERAAHGQHLPPKSTKWKCKWKW